MLIKPANLTSEENAYFQAIVASKGKNKGQLLKNKPNKGDNVGFLWDKVAARILSGYFGAFFAPIPDDDKKAMLSGLAAKIVELNLPGMYLEGDYVKQRGLSGMAALCYYGEEVNQLDYDTILTIFYAAKFAPYPMGKYAEVLTELPQVSELYDMSKFENVTLGALRYELAKMCQGSMNGVHDSYVRAAVDLLS